MKTGIRESRSLNSSVTSGNFSPVPEIETPKVQPISCAETLLLKKDSDGNWDEGEKIQLVQFAITNAVYGPKNPEFTSPNIEQLGDRKISGDDYSLELESSKVITSNRVANLNESTPKFITWRNTNESTYRTDVRISYNTWGSGAEPQIVKEKSFNVEIAADCKTAKVISP